MHSRRPYLRSNRRRSNFGASSSPTRCNIICNTPKHHLVAPIWSRLLLQLTVVIIIMQGPCTHSFMSPFIPFTSKLTARSPIIFSQIISKDTNSSIAISNDDALYYKCNVNGHNNDTIIVDELFDSLVQKVAAYSPQSINTPSINSNSTIPILQQAYQYAKAAHEGQCRKSGEPYIIHPLNVAHIIADMKLDLPSLLCALLHDTVEDTPVTLNDISTTFGEEIAQLVDGVTKVGKIPLTWSYEEKQSENYRKLILSISKDIRVLLVKLADRAHNMRTLQYMSAEKQKRISRETMEIFAPLAHRLGIHWLKTELEDNCFKYMNPDKYEVLDKQVKGSEMERNKYIEMVVNMLVKQMEEAGLGGENSTLLVTGRTKGLYSIHTKMKKQDIDFNDVHDVLAFRIIVDDIASCYQALGVVHSHFKPVPGKIKDYIALPKPNGYRSLHTTIFGPGGRLEIQIRTKDMHEVAESGIAAHWMYKQGSNGKSPKEKVQFQWLRELVAEVKQQTDPKEFVKSVKEGKKLYDCMDLLSRMIYSL